MFVDHALGLAGGTGGVDHIGGVLGNEVWYLRVGGGLVLPGAVVEVDYRHVPQQAAGGALGQHHHRRAVVQHVGDALWRVRRVQRHIGTAGLEDGEQTDDHVQAALDADAHPCIRAHTAVTQVMGQAVGAFIELLVAQGVLAGLHRHCLRGTYNLGFKQPVQGLVEVVVHLGGVELHQQLLPLLQPQHRQAVQRLVRCLLKSLDQAAQRVMHIAAHPLRIHLGQGGECIAVAQVIHVQGQRVIGAPVIDQGLHAFPCQLRIRRAGGGAAMAIVEHRAEQGRRGRYATATLGQRQGGVFMAEQFGQPRMGGPHGGAGALVVDIQAQRQGVDKHAQSAVGSLAALQTAHQYRAEHHRMARRYRGQHLRPGQMEQAGSADPQQPCLAAQAAVELAVQLQGVFVDGIAVAAHVLPAERQRRFVDIAQHLAEELLMLLFADTQTGLGHIVAIRHWRGGGRCVAQQVALHFAQHHVEGGVVQHDMMIEQHRHHALVGRVLGVHQADQRRLADLQAIPPRIKPLVQAGEYVTFQLQFLHAQLRLAPHHLQRLRQALPHHPGAQDVVAVDHLLQCAHKGLQALHTVKRQV